MPEEYDDRERYPLVYIPDEKCFGIVISMGAFVSKVRYFIDGIEYEADMENSEFIERKDVNFGYVTE